MKTFVTILILALTPLLQADEKDAILKSLNVEIQKAFGEEAKNVTTTFNKDSLSLEYKARKFMVHNRSMSGELSEKAYEVTGPSYKGLTLGIHLQEKSDEQEQWARPKDARGATIAAQVSEPYWNKLVWVMPFDNKNLTARIYLSHGVRMDRDILANLKALFAKIR